jgi:signal transduction histidine kinase
MNWTAFRLAMARGDPQYQVEKRVVRKDGTVIWVRVHVGVVKGEPGVSRRTAAVVEDITARKEAEAALLELNATLEDRVSKRSHQLAVINEALQAEIRERQRVEEARTALLKRLAHTQEEERRRLARELHDHSGQLLTALALGLKQLEEVPAEGSSTHERLRRLRDLVDQLGREVHSLALELRPTALDDVGLAEALASYAETWSRRTRVEVDYHGEGLSRRLPGELETTLYRVVQEALTNVLKHSGARRVSLILEQRDGHAVAIVEDDGRGFRPARLRRAPDLRPCLGLLGMEERLEAVGGSLEIESTPGKGTTLFAKVPVPGAERCHHE